MVETGRRRHAGLNQIVHILAFPRLVFFHQRNVCYLPDG